MRLLKLEDDGSFSPKWFSGDEVPPYAILSHTWGAGEDDEVTLKDLNNGTAKNKLGIQKLQFCSKQAKDDDLHYFWVDTCCIDKQDLNELTTAINSMFRWYQNAARCYVYLSDVAVRTHDSQFIHKEWDSAFRNSRWFGRGWTLQELLAPKIVVFYSRDGVRLGDKDSLKQQIAEITGIPVEALRERALSKFSIKERFLWVEKRQTTKAEDKAYCLLGIFQVFLPLIYGEGQSSAMKRLQKEIQESMNTELQPSDRSNYSIPFPRNRRFTGRTTVLQDLEQKLLINKESREVALVGLGGIGKTQAALEFAYRVKADWPDYSIFWIPALSIETMEQACGEIARILEIPRVADVEEDVKELVQGYLSSNAAGKWLLIVDNADDINLFQNQQSKGLADYLPRSENGLILLTTRYLEVAVSFADSDVVELDEMDKQEAISFLKRSLIRKNLLDNDAIATELLHELTSLPLAITQASAYLNRNKNVSIADYLRFLRNREQDMVSLLSQEFRDSTRYKDAENAVAKTWLVSFDQIRDQDTVAAELLSFMSCIEPKAIPRSILPSLQMEERMVRAIGTLCAYSFVARRGNEEIYDMHRLVHVATRLWVGKHGIAVQTLEKAIRHVSNVFPRVEYANRSIWRGYLIHTLRLLGKKLDREVEERYTLCMKIGRCLYQEGRVGECVQWYEETYQWRNNNLTEEDPLRLASQHGLASAYKADGQVKKAVKLLEHVVAVESRLLSEVHTDRLRSQHELARAYKADGQIKEAVELLEHVVAVRKRVLTEEHPERLASQHELASAYEADGQVRKAVELLEHVVAVEKKLLSEEYPDRLASQHGLARAYKADGQIKKAVELLEHVVAVRRRVLTEEHPDRLASQHELARAYKADGQIKEAVELLEHVVAVESRVLSEEHPSRLVSQHELARAYKADGQIKEAVELLEHVVAVRKRVLTEEHPDRLASQHELARVYKADGQIKKAVELLEHVVAVERRKLGEKHPSRLVSQHELAYAYEANGQVKKAVELLEHVVAVGSIIFQKDHPQRLRSENMLENMYAQLSLNS